MEVQSIVETQLLVGLERLSRWKLFFVLSLEVVLGIHIQMSTTMSKIEFDILEVILFLSIGAQQY